MAERLPLDPARLRADVARLWPACAAVTGLDPCRPGVGAWERCGLLWYRLGIAVLSHVETAAALRAVEQLARCLEDEGYEVSRDEAGPDVVGRVGVRERAGALVDIALVPPWHPETEARTQRLRTERDARDVTGAPGPDMRRAGGLARWKASYGREAVVSEWDADAGSVAAEQAPTWWRGSEG